MTGGSNRKHAVEHLKTAGCSCVICNKGGMFSFFERGVADLLGILETEPALLEGAFVADKVVGKAAAALMIAGGVKEVYAVTISKPALDLLNGNNIKTAFEVLTDHVINRSGTDWCPLEKLCSGAAEVSECVALVKGFVNGIKQ